MSEFKSTVHQIAASQTVVYNRISDLSNLEEIKHGMNNPEFAQKLIEQIGQDQFDQMKQYMEKVSFDKDTITVGNISMGDIHLRIIEREEPKTIKMEVDGTPMPINMWIQLLPNGSEACAVRVVIKAELNFFIKQMASKPLQKAADGIAELIARIPYNQSI